MFNKVSKFLCVLFLGVWTLQVQAARLIPDAPAIAAKAYLVIDADTGKVIVAKNENERFAPASLTKMMTAYILEYELNKGNVGVDDLVLISETRGVRRVHECLSAKAHRYVWAT